MKLYFLFLIVITTLSYGETPPSPTQHAEGPSQDLRAQAESPKQDSAEVDRINQAIQNRYQIAEAAWDDLIKKGEFSLGLDDYEAALRKQMNKYWGGNVPEKELTRIYSILGPKGVALMKESRIKEWWSDEEFSKLKVRGFYDLTQKDLPEDLKKLVKYFKDEYGKDITSTRVLLVDGMGLGELGKHIGRKLAVNTLNAAFTLKQGDAKLELSGPVKLNGADKYLDATQAKIFGAKDVLLIDAGMFARMRGATMAVGAHELRHEINQNSDSPAFKRVITQQKEIVELFKSKGASLVKEEKEALAKAPHFQQYMKALEAFNVAKNPALKGTEPLKDFLVKQKEETLDSSSEGLLQEYLSKKTDYETRGYWEQARYARVVLGWDKAKYLKTITKDIPAEFLDRDPTMKKNYAKMDNGEKILLDIGPPSAFAYRFFGDLFDRAGKIPDKD